MFCSAKATIQSLRSLLFCYRDRFQTENKEAIENKSISHIRRFFYKTLLLNPVRIFNILTGRELNVRHIEVVLTTVCSLRCKGCSALMPLYPPSSTHHIDIDLITKSIQGLMKSLDSIYWLGLLGGEPFLYPNLFDVLCLIKDEKKVRHANIITNGTLLIKDEQVMDILKDSKFNIIISDYGPYSKKKTPLIQQLKSNGIKYRVVNHAYWKDYGDVVENNCDEKELRKKFLYCRKIKSNCNSIIGGKLYHCPRGSHGANLGVIPSNEKDYVDLLDNNLPDRERKKRLFRFLYRTPYAEACKYCNLSKYMDTIPVASQI